MACFTTGFGRNQRTPELTFYPAWKIDFGLPGVNQVSVCVVCASVAVRVHLFVVQSSEGMVVLKDRLMALNDNLES